MGKVTLDPYLFFTGNCQEAMEFYQSVFGGELTLNTYDEMGGEPMANMKGKIMHANLQGGDINLMASDSTRESFGDSFISLSLSGTDEAKIRALFDKLAEGGTEVSAPKKESWGDIFGSLTDKFGVDWMVNIGAEQ